MDYSDQTPLHELTTEQLKQKLEQVQHYCNLFETLKADWNKGTYHVMQAIGLFMMDNTRSRRERLRALDSFACRQHQSLSMSRFQPSVKELSAYYNHQAKQLNELILLRTT